MYVIVYENNGQLYTIAAANKTLAKNRLKDLHNQNLASTWRMMDNTGWCDGSENAYESISFLPSYGTMDIIFR